MTVELARPTAREQTRARYPDEEGYVERDGVRLFYEVYGAGEPTVLLLPTWSIIHSRHWKMQIPYLARHCRVLTFDGRGNGRSDRPPEPDAYREEEFAADALAVMDATATERAVLVSLSRGAERSLLLAASHPERVDRLVFIAPALPLPPATPREQAMQEFDEPRDEYVGWGKWNRHYWVEHYERLPRVLLLAVLHRAALDEAARGRGRLGARDRRRDAGRDPARAARSRTRRACASSCARDPLPGARDPRERRRHPALRLRARLAELAGGALIDPRGLGPLPARARPGQGQPAPARLRRAGAAAAQLGARQVAPQARPLHLLADRARPRAARRGDRRRAAQAPSRPRDRLAGPASGHGGAGGARRADPSGERLPRQRVAPHRERVGRARPALLPGDPADGRDPARQLHGLPRPRARGALRPLDRRRGLGARLLPAREPGAEAGAVRLADRLRRLAADARRRRPRGVPDRRLQRGDDRAHRALPARARSGRLRRQPRGHRAGAVRVPPALDPRVDRGALLVRRLRHGLRSRRVRRPGGAPGRARLRRGRAGLHRHRRRLGRRRRPPAARDRRLPGGEGAGAGAADDRRRRAADRPGDAAGARRARGARLRPRALPAPRRLRPRRRPGRPDDLDGADGEPAPVPLLPAPPPLRAEPPRPPPARPLRRRPLHGLRARDAGDDRRRDRRDDRPGRRLPAGRVGRRRAGSGADRAAARGGQAATAPQHSRI